VLKEGLTQMSEKPGEVKDNYSPTSPKIEPQTVSQQVSQRAIWLIRNNEESVRITLDPPQLGHIYMEIDRNKENIKTTLWTDNPATKATLETNQTQIQKIIESDGFKLDKFDVFVQQDMNWYQGGKDDSTNPNPRSPASPSEIQAPLSDSPEPLPAVVRAAHPASKYLDLFSPERRRSNEYLFCSLNRQPELDNIHNAQNYSDAGRFYDPFCHPAEIPKPLAAFG
jgi:hypothetical protein